MTTREYLTQRIATLNGEKTSLVNEQATKVSEIDAKVEQYRNDLTKGVTDLYTGLIEKKNIEIAAVQASLDAAPAE
ncbi:MAG: hypothetical protein AB7E61_06390 [Acholeplasmataceae bacterium]